MDVKIQRGLLRSLRSHSQETVELHLFRLQAKVVLHLLLCTALDRHKESLAEALSTPSRHFLL